MSPQILFLHPSEFNKIMTFLLIIMTESFYLLKYKSSHWINVNFDWPLRLLHLTWYMCIISKKEANISHEFIFCYLCFFLFLISSQIFTSSISSTCKLLFRNYLYPREYHTHFTYHKSDEKEKSLNSICDTIFAPRNDANPIP